MPNLPIELSESQWLGNLRESQVKNRLSLNAVAMFSSLCRGITTDPALMIVPIEDHIVHRGDGVFEAVRIASGSAYQLRAHLDRLKTSAAFIGLEIPWDVSQLTEIIRATGKSAKRARPNLKDALIRIFVSRGPGGFTTNPYDSMGPQLYVVITEFRAVAEEKYQSGVSIDFSRVQVKEGQFANIKSCNYLPNVMMKKEAVDSGLDFTVTLDENGYLAEGSTENCAIVDQDGKFVAPKFDRILKGITLSRCLDLAETLTKTRGIFSAVEQRHITRDDIMKAREMAMIGTTLDVLPVAKLGPHVFGQANALNLAQRNPRLSVLLAELRQDLVMGLDLEPMWVG